MTTDLQSWQRSTIRNQMARYRRAQEDYYVSGKPLVTLDDGAKAFSLVSPPLGSPAARRRVRRIVDTMARTGASSQALAIRTPHVATVAVTYACQCACAHCSAVDYERRTSRAGASLTIPELADTIAQAVDLGATCVILTGGEPLLLGGVCDLVASVDRSRSVCTIFTNGELLTADMVAALKAAGLFGVFVSLDHADARSHAAHRRRPGLWQKATDGLKRCQEAGILTGISTYVTREKLSSGEMNQVMDVARALGVLEVFLFDVIPTGRLNGQRDRLLTDREAEQIVEFRRMYTSRPDYPRIVHQTMFASIAYPCVAEGCPAAMVQLHVRANGDVSPCDFTPCSFGNIRERPLKEIWDTMAASALYAQPSARCRLSRPDFWLQLDDVGCVTSYS
jgi:MoaA/NifB/PqqE/SkfB family radical SAM enzyme